MQTFGMLFIGINIKWLFGLCPDDFSVTFYVGHFAAQFYLRHALFKVLRIVELGVDGKLAVFVDESIQGTHFHGGKPFCKVVSIRELRVYLEFAFLVEVAP